MGETNIVDFLKVSLIVMLFYSLCINLITYSIPDEAKVYISDFTAYSDTINAEDITGEVQAGLQSQTNIPVIEAGALVFYSGNLLIDLILNFMFAIPQMIGLLFHAIQILFNLNGYMFAVVQGFFSVIMTVLYLIGVIQLITGIRSGRIV